MNRKGFTLIEIIAVIIIIGIIMFIAVPNVSSYILDSRKKTYVNDAKRFITAAENFVNTKEIPVNKTDITYYIPKECLPVDKSLESPYGIWKKVYVAVTYDGSNYNYYFTSVDSEKMGMYLTYSEDIDTSKIKDSVSEDDISLTLSIGKKKNGKCLRDKIRVINDSCNISDSTLISGINKCIADKTSF